MSQVQSSFREISPLEQQFIEAERTLLAALNGRGISHPCTEAHIAKLRWNVLQAKHACLDAGIQVQTLAEVIQEQRGRDEIEARTYAQEQLKIVPVIPGLLRRKIVLGSAVLMWGALIAFAPSLIDFVAGLFFSPLLLFALDLLLSEIFPTPAVRIARFASERCIDVSDLWPENSVDLLDYKLAYSRHLLRLRQRSGGKLIRFK